MKRFMMAAALLAAGAAWACDDHVGECQIEDWRWTGMGDILMVEGVATFDKGQVRLRLYEGEGGPFLGVAHGYLEGHAFQAMATDIPSPSMVAIKYSIEPD